MGHCSDINVTVWLPKNEKKHKSSRVLVTVVCHAGLAKLVFLMYDNLDELLQPEQVARDSKTSEHYSSDDSYAELKGPKETYYKPADSKETAGKDDENDDKLSDKDYGEKDILTTTAKMLEEMTKVPPREEGVKTIVNSKIVSASIGDANTTHLSEPVIYTLEHQTVKELLYWPLLNFIVHVAL